MKVIVCGGRDFTDERFVFLKLDVAHKRRPISMVISGGAKGVDTLAIKWADARNIHCVVVNALWSPDGKSIDKGAGPKRNRAMLTLAPDALIAFPGGSGTADMVKAATEAGLMIWHPLKDSPSAAP